MGPAEAGTVSWCQLHGCVAVFHSSWWPRGEAEKTGGPVSSGRVWIDRVSSAEAGVRAGICELSLKPWPVCSLLRSPVGLEELETFTGF